MLNECLYIKIVSLNLTSNFFLPLYAECSFIKCIIPKVVVVADRTAKVYKFISQYFD